VPLERFKGKRVLFVKVAEGISRPQELINEAQNAPIYQGAQDFQELREEEEAKVSLGHSLYKHLMNGVSYMLPFVVGGGLLIALSFLIDGYYVDLLNASDGVKKAFGSNSEIAKFFMGIGGMAFSFMLPILSGFIAMSIADRPALVVGFVGGAIAKAGSSGFLGAILAGFLAGYIVLGLKRALTSLPQSLDGMKPILLYPLLGILGVALVMTYVVEPPVGAINTFVNEGLNSMNGEWKVLLGILLGVMMATDLGGPINKAAYVFGVASIASKNYDVMAAVMIGGMVPPLVIALATTFFKSKFTPAEQKSGVTNYVMGLSFITEGAIPFAASDPLRVLGSCMIGSGIAGGLSMFFGCGLMAPHGGIFVFPVVQNVLYYCLSLVIGSIVGAVILGIWKKEK
ncbi:fructose-specific PTS transporter subunit EIIC, partial [uncultured Helicobacter sp.]|uniref:PTS fructose transporter subunit IIC n=1 Tax=uncultured Helicobacter sp. TaxID=175537 RepID=UPI002628FC10